MCFAYLARYAWIISETDEEAMEESKILYKRLAKWVSSLFTGCEQAILRNNNNKKKTLTDHEIAYKFMNYEYSCYRLIGSDTRRPIKKNVVI